MRLLKLVKIFASLTLLISVIMPSISTYAASKEQRGDALRSTSWDDQESKGCSSTATESTAGNSTPGKLFLLGDSIGQGLEPSLPDYLKEDDGWSIEADVKPGRFLPEGKQIVDANPKGPEGTSHILIVLGTNSLDTPVEEMQALVDAVDPSITKHWLSLNVATGVSNAKTRATDFNSRLAEVTGVNVIQNTIVPDDPDGYHYDLAAGTYKQIADLVARGIQNGGTAAGAAAGVSGGSCQCNNGSGGANISAVDKNFTLGSGAKERRMALMQALINDFGITPAQAAGIIGNFTQESGGQDLPPDINEGMEKGPPDMSRDRGYGWAQWTHINGSRKTQFIESSIAAGYMGPGEPATDAANYFFLKKELTENYANAIEDLKKQQNPRDAAVSFHTIYEGSDDGPEGIGERATDAEAWLKEWEEGGSTGGGGGSTTCGGSASILGETAFPLIINKSKIGNNTIFANNTTTTNHPYTAYDIFTPEGAPVVAFMSGTVTSVKADGACDGGLQAIQIYNQEEDKTVYYTHIKNGTVVVKADDQVQPGTPLAATPNTSEVTGLAGGCSTAHLHIDVVTGKGRPGCSRSSCPASAKSRFIDIGPLLFQTYQLLPE